MNPREREPLPSAKLSAAVGLLQESRRGSQCVHAHLEGFQEEVSFSTVKNIKLSPDWMAQSVGVSSCAPRLRVQSQSGHIPSVSSIPSPCMYGRQPTDIPLSYQCFSLFLSSLLLSIKSIKKNKQTPYPWARI